VKKTKDHPFFCYKKNCSKTAWNTPEYLSPEDWDFLAKVYDTLKNGNGEQLHALLWSVLDSIAEHFFNHSIGWAEGYTYCRNLRYVQECAFDGMVRHQLPKIKIALERIRQ